MPASIASAANKQLGAHLKRSASLDDPLPAKHPARKPSFGALVAAAPARPFNGLGQRESTPPGQGRGGEKGGFYSSMASAYTHEVAKRKLLPMNLPLSSISVSKINEAFPIYASARSSAQPALTITSHPKQTAAQQMINFLPYAPLNKPALEIVRITSNQVPADKQPLPPLSPPRQARPPQPPIPLLKIKKPGQQAATANTPSPPAPQPKAQSSPPALVNMRNTIPLSLANKAPTAQAKEAKATNGGPAEKPKASLRDFRPASKDGSVEILDLSAPSKPQEAPKAKATPPPTTTSTSAPVSSPPGSSSSSSSSSSLEAALNKIKQNMTSCTVSDSLQSSKLQAAKASSDDLQNLHLLSESATSREKIAIKPQPKLYEMPKAQQQGVVRQQNASVRNIPNPSALAFRNQPSLSMLASVASPPSAQLNPPSPSPSASVSAAASGPPSAEPKTLSPPALFVSSPKSPGASHQVSPRAKKLTSIDQVAASLNIRAAAAEAEASAAKAASGEESAQVSSNSEAKPTLAEPASGPRSEVEASSTTVSSSAAVSSTTTTTTAAEASSTTMTATAAAAAASVASPSASLPKTSFKSISSLVASTASQPSAVASSV